MPKITTTQCGNCGRSITSSTKAINERKLRNASGQVYCPKCSKAYGGFSKVKCAECGQEFSYRAAAGLAGAAFKTPKRCPDCRAGQEESKSLRCHWHPERTAMLRAGEILPGRQIGACRECKDNLITLMQGGIARWVEINARIGFDGAGFVDPWYNLGTSYLQAEDNIGIKSSV